MNKKYFKLEYRQERLKKTTDKQYCYNSRRSASFCLLLRDLITDRFTFTLPARLKMKRLRVGERYNTIEFESMNSWRAYVMKEHFYRTIKETLL